MVSTSVRRSLGAPQDGSPTHGLEGPVSARSVGAHDRRQEGAPYRCHRPIRISPIESVGIRSTCTSAEHHCANHDAGDSKQGRDVPENRERQQEREHEKDRAYTDQDGGHGITVCRIFTSPAGAC